ncbi:hypothetical protein AB6E20_21660, partial [Vibrio cyclitrophicus]
DQSPELNVKFIRSDMVLTSKNQRKHRLTHWRANLHTSWQKKSTLRTFLVFNQSLNEVKGVIDTSPRERKVLKPARPAAQYEQALALYTQKKNDT